MFLEGVKLNVDLIIKINENIKLNYSIKFNY